MASVRDTVEQVLQTLCKCQLQLSPSPTTHLVARTKRWDGPCAPTTAVLPARVLLHSPSPHATPKHSKTTFRRYFSAEDGSRASALSVQKRALSERLT